MKLHQYARRYGLRVTVRTLVSRLRAWALEDQAGAGLGGPPNNWQSLETFYVTRRSADEKGGPYAYGYNAMFGNDASEVWIGSREIDKQGMHERWQFHCSTRVFRRIAVWYLWRWAWGEWFGLRRKLFYWDLKRRVNRRPGW